MDFCVFYGEAQVEVQCRVPAGTKLQGLLESRSVRRNALFLQKILGLEGEEWHHRFVPNVDSSKMTAKGWCNFKGSSIVFSPPNGARSRIPVEAAGFRALPEEDRVQTLLAASNEPELVDKVWKSVRDALGDEQEQQQQQQDDLTFWVVYAEAWENVSVKEPGHVHMHDVYRLPEGIAATRKLLRQLQMDEGRACELKMRFIPELKAFQGGPLAVQWSKFKGATVMFCEDPDVENERQEGSLYKQASLYRKFLQRQAGVNPSS